MIKKMLFFGIITAGLIFLGACSGDWPTEPDQEPVEGSTPDSGTIVEPGSQVEGITIDSVCHKYWFRIDVESGTDYVFRTYDLTTDGDGNDTDTYMYLFNENDKNNLDTMDIEDLEANYTDYNDDCDGILCGSNTHGTEGETQSTIIWNATYTGTVYVCVTTFECTNGNPTLDNTVNPGYSFQVFLPTP